MRHAKSSWSHPGLTDFDRPLNERGLRDAPRMGQYLKELNLLPDQIFSSPAARAKATIEAVVKELDLDVNQITWDKDLYFAGTASYINAIRRADEKSNIVMTVGHNPMSEGALDLLSNSPVNGRFVTAAIACLKVNSSSWKEISYGQCDVKWIMTPKDLQSN